MSNQTIWNASRACCTGSGWAFRSRLALLTSLFSGRQSEAIKVVVTPSSRACLICIAVRELSLGDGEDGCHQGAFYKFIAREALPQMYAHSGCAATDVSFGGDDAVGFSC